MPTQKWIVRLADGTLIGGGFSQPIPPDSTYTVVELPEDTPATPATHRYDFAAGTIRLATQAEIDAYKATLTSAQAQSTSRQVDLMTTVGFVIARVNPSAWTAMTNAQKKTAITNGCDQWRDLRATIAALMA
jgi:hypothetical protein